jgi:hypothetical protein
MKMNDADLVQELRRDVAQYDSNIRTSATEEHKNKLCWYRDRVNLAADRIEALSNPSLLVAAKIAQEILSKRLPGIDQNPRGVMDLLGSAILNADQ